MGDAVTAVEQSEGDVEAERAISFELFLCKHLVERGLVREVAVTLFIVKDIIVFVAGERSFNVNKDALAAAWIFYLANRTMGTVMLVCVSLFINFLAGVEAFISDLLPRQVYSDAEVDQCIALQRVERAERHLSISFGIDRNDDATAPPE